MRVGTVRERKDGENRVALTPEAVYALVSAGSEVVLEASAGVGAGYGDAAYTAVGGTVVADASAVWSTSDLVVKVKEPVPAEYDQLVRRDPPPTLFTYLHLAADHPLTEQLLASGWTTLAYELVARPDGSLPLLAPMSQVAGHMAAEVGAGLLKQPGPGKGKLLGGIAGVAAGKVVILGSGSVATAAVRVLLGSEARIVVMSRDLARLSYLQEHFGGRITTRTSSPQSVAEELEDADLVILAVLVPGATAPRVVTREMLRRMEPGGCPRRCLNRPGWRGRDEPSHDPQRPHVCRRGNRPLLCDEHAWRRSPYQHALPGECDPALYRNARGARYRGRPRG